MADTTGSLYLADLIERFHVYRRLGERALAQVDDAGLHFRLGPEENSIAVMVKHLAGNMRSRWTDFLTTDGEKPDRRRDEEFEVAETTTRAEVMAWWEAGWGRLFQTLAELSPADLERPVTVGGKPMAALQAINTQYGHYAYHVGQIVTLARHLAGEGWQSLSVPKRRPGRA